jgi:peptide/nickel transport system permease protein
MLRVFQELLSRNAEFLVGLVLVAAVVVFALLSYLAPIDPALVYRVPPEVPPDAQYWFGTNSRGQDLFWELALSFRNTLTFGITVAVLSRILAVAVGLLAGYLGGWVDRALMFATDIFVAIPLFPMLILFYFVMRANMSWLALALLMAGFGWPFDARVIRSIAIGLRYREFTRHAVFAGMSPAEILLREHLPYVMPIIFASTINNMIWSIGLEVTLAVLGYTDLNRPTVGTTLYWANNHSALVVGTWWWIAIPVAIVVILFVGLFLLAMSLNEYIDPRSRLRRVGA